MLFGRAWVVTILSVASSTNVRLGFFDEPQPFELACARGWFNHPEHNVSCLLQPGGEIAAAALDDGDLHMAGSLRGRANSGASHLRCCSRDAQILRLIPRVCSAGQHPLGQSNFSWS